MSLICSKCRRIVRNNNIHYKEGEYYCGRCQCSFKIPKNFYKRDDLVVPILFKSSELIVHKNEEDLSIEFPLHLNTLSFKVASGIFLFFLYIFVNNYEPNNNIVTFYFLSISIVLLLLSFFKAIARQTLFISRDTICLSKSLFRVRLKNEKKIDEIKRIREINMDLETRTGIVLGTSFYIEIEFKDESYFKLGHSLGKKDRTYLLAELKLAHFYNHLL